MSAKIILLCGHGQFIFQVRSCFFI